MINASTNSTIRVDPNKTYLVRVILLGNFPGHAFVFDQHDTSVVEVDGVWLEEYPVGERNVRIATGQRMTMLLKTKSDASKLSRESSSAFVMRHSSRRHLTESV